MSVKIVTTEFKIHSTPLEQLILKSGQLIAEFDDIHEQRVRLIFKGIRGLRVMDDDCITDYSLVMVGDTAPRHLLEMEPSAWKEDYVSRIAIKHIILRVEAFRHFILPLRDYVVEILADDFSVST